VCFLLINLLTHGTDPLPSAVACLAMRMHVLLRVDLLFAEEQTMRSMKNDLAIGASLSALVMACALAWGDPLVTPVAAQSGSQTSPGESGAGQTSPSTGGQQSDPGQGSSRGRGSRGQDSTGQGTSGKDSSGQDSTGQGSTGKDSSGQGSTSGRHRRNRGAQQPDGQSPSESQPPSDSQPRSQSQPPAQSQQPQV
jgi:hypothetical protein